MRSHQEDGFQILTSSHGRHTRSPLPLTFPFRCVCNFFFQVPTHGMSKMTPDELSVEIGPMEIMCAGRQRGWRMKISFIF